MKIISVSFSLKTLQEAPRDVIEDMYNDIQRAAGRLGASWLREEHRDDTITVFYRVKS